MAMLSLPEDPDADRVVRIESLVITDGEIRIVGRHGAAKAIEPP